MNWNARTRSRAARGWTLALVALVAFAAAVSAQQLTGNIFGYVADEQGGRLPGVSVTLSGIGAARAQVTDSRGEYRFVSLSPGEYTLTYELQGFTRVEKPNVQVSVGQNTNTSATLQISAAEATITVRGEPSLLDTRKVETGAVVDQTELQQIPTARDPWVILATVPGVQVDRVNVGGNESGQQSSYVGKGSITDQNSWNVDGTTITDMGALGSSPTYYDFDSFEQITAATGGSDVTAASPGVQLNLVTKRGTNEVHGSARFYLADQDFQWNNLSQEAIDQGVTGGNRINEVQDYGIEVGGPVWTDRIWLWGAYGRGQINLFNIAGSPDNTTLEDVNGKLNIQATDSTSLAGAYTYGDKLKFGRNVSVTRPLPASWNQTGPTTIWKGEITQIFSAVLYATASYSNVDGGFSLLPVGGTAYNALYINPDGVWQGSYLAYSTVRPQDQFNTSGSFFFSTGSLGHELKFGFNYRETPVSSNSSWPGNGNYGDEANFASPVATMTRPAVVATNLNYTSAYLSDTLTAGNLTINAGARFDFQRGQNLASTTPANPVIPDLMPSITSTDAAYSVEWEDIVPRVGATYALGKDGKTLLKASYAQYADQLGVAPIAFTNPGALSGLYYYWDDVNGDHVITRDELDLDGPLVSFYGLDPDNPGSAISPNTIAPNFDAGKTDEIIAGIEREVMPDFVVGVAYTYRQYDGSIFPRRTGLTEADYELAGNVEGILFNGQPFSEPYYRLREGVDIPAGITIENRPNFQTTYNGVDLTFQKRLTNKWLVRGAFTWQNWQQSGGPGSCYDPTRDRGGNNELWPGTAIGLQTGVTCGGDDIAAYPAGASSGAKNEVFLNSTWQFNVGGLYQLPVGFALAANFYGRQGYPFINYYRINPGDGLGNRDVIIGKLDSFRYDDVLELDLRLEKVITLKPLSITLAADLFNALNQGTVLQRNANAAQASIPPEDGGYNQIREIQSPRIFRFGARVSF